MNNDRHFDCTVDSPFGKHARYDAKMLPLKRKRVEKDNSTSSDGESAASSENEWEDQTEKDEEDSEIEFIQDAITKRNVKEGTEFLKKTSKVKGKGKARGEIGGGSFQSMGTPDAKFLKIITDVTYL